MDAIIENFQIWKISRKLADYKPCKVTYASIHKWLDQFDKKDHKILLKLLRKVIYFSENELDLFLKNKNDRLIKKLNETSIPNEKIIYITIDETATSSHIILNKIKRLNRMERGGFKFHDAHRIMELNTAIKEVGNGAIIYVDDFSGTGKQICESRDFIVDNIPSVSTNFSEYFLAHCICEEALMKLGERKIEPFTDHIHSISERVLHPDNTDNFFTQNEKSRLLELSRLISTKEPLGHKNLATMVVLYSNSPNTTPLVLRGNIGQNKYIGVIPRTTDFT